MASTYLDLTKGLEQKAYDILTASPISMSAGQIAFPNVVFQPVQNAKHARLFQMYGKTLRVTVGVNGQNYLPGILQVSLHYPYGKGNAEVLAAGQAVKDGFPEGLQITRNGTTLTILRSYVGPGLDVEGGWIIAPVSVEWYVYS